MPFSEDADQFRQRIKINWKTGGVVLDRPLGPLSARTAEHKAVEAEFLGDPALQRRPAVPHGSLEADLLSTAKWSRGVAVSANPDLANFGRSGVRHLKASRKLRPTPGPKEVSCGEPAGERRDAASPLVLPNAKGGKQTPVQPRHKPATTQVPGIAQRLVAGVGISDMLSAAAQLLHLAQGQGKAAVEVREAVSEITGILYSLLKLVKLCQPPHQMHKPMVMKTLSQLCFYNQKNADVLAGEEDMLGQMTSAVFSGIELLQMETARLFNNMVASSVHAAERLCRYPDMLEAIRHLCSNSNFLIRFRAASAVNCLTRHALSNLKLGALLSEAGLVSELTKASGIGAGNAEQSRLYGFMVTCACGNSIGTIERRTWAANEKDLETAVAVFHAARVGGKFAGVTCHIHAVLLSLRFLTSSEKNKKELFNCGLVEELAAYVEEWEEDPSKDLAVQLGCLESAIDLLLRLLTVDGHTVIKTKLFQTEVKKRLRNLEFGASLFRAIKFRPSHLAVDLAHRLVKELQLKPDRYTQLFLDKAEQPQKDRLASSSSRMMGTSRSIPRSSQAEWCHPLTAGAGGNPPSIPRPNKTPTTGARHTGPDCEFMMGPWDDGAGQPPAGLLWNFPSKRSAMMLIRQHICRGWKRLHADLQDMAESVSHFSKGESENSIGATDVYKILGGHRIWFDAEEWRDFLETLAPSQSDPMLLPCTLDLRPLVQEVGKVTRATSGSSLFSEKRDVNADILVLDGCDSPLNRRGGDTWPVGRVTGSQGRYQSLVSTMLFKQVEADLNVICEALAPSETVSIFKLETLLRSLGWALTRSELERIRQTFDTGDASLGLVSSDDFIEVFAQATSPSEGVLELVAKIAQTEDILAATGEPVGSYHEALGIEKKSQWKKKLQRQLKREGTSASKSSTHRERPASRGTTRAGFFGVEADSPSRVGMQPSTTRSRMSRASTSTAVHTDFTGGERRRVGEAHPLGEPMFFHATPG